MNGFFGKKLNFLKIISPPTAMQQVLHLKNYHN